MFYMMEYFNNCCFEYNHNATEFQAGLTLASDQAYLKQYYLFIQNSLFYWKVKPQTSQKSCSTFFQDFAVFSAVHQSTLKNFLGIVCLVFQCRMSRVHSFTGLPFTLICGELIPNNGFLLSLFFLFFYRRPGLCFARLIGFSQQILHMSCGALQFLQSYSGHQVTSLNNPIFAAPISLKWSAVSWYVCRCPIFSSIL